MDANLIEIPGERVARQITRRYRGRANLCHFFRAVFTHTEKLNPHFGVAMDAKASSQIFHLEVGQEPVNDIHPVERVALLFSSADESYPEILALRADFPQVTHLNLREPSTRGACVSMKNPIRSLGLLGRQSNFWNESECGFATLREGYFIAMTRPLSRFLCRDLGTS